MMMYEGREVEVDGEERGEKNLVVARATGCINQGELPSGTTLVDASNGFNELIHLSILCRVLHRWLAGARFAINCYNHWAQLLLYLPG